MTDREKVIRAYECCKNSYDRICEKCPYEKDCCHDGIPMFVIKKMVELLKEQEAVKPVLDEQTGRIWLCGKCGSYVGFEDNDPHDPNEFDKYCRECGRSVLWEGR